MGLCGAFTQAKVQLPAFFSDGMVMQQQATANLWGTATPRKTVTLTTGWTERHTVPLLILRESGICQ